MNYFLRRLPLVATLVLVLFQAGVVCACPSCKDGLEQGQSHLIQSYFWSILFMMSMPFIIFGSLCTYFYLEVRRARVRQSLASAATTPLAPG